MPKSNVDQALSNARSYARSGNKNMALYFIHRAEQFGSVSRQQLANVYVPLGLKLPPLPRGPRTTAQIIIGDTDTNWRRVVIETASGFCVHPMLWPDGLITYDYPERVPEFIKPKVRRLLEKLRDEGYAPWSVASEGEG